MKNYKKIALENLKERMKEIKEILNADDPIEELNNHILSWDGADLQFSWGGPSDGFYLAINAEGYLAHAVYYYREWDGGEEIPLYGQNFELIEKLYETCLKVE